jgi:uncharacterized membrane protein YhaH (DUF805 family)
MAKFRLKSALSPYFSAKGRIGRGEFWGYSLLLGFVSTTVAFLLSLLPFPVGELLALGVWGLALVAHGSLLVSRGHDRGRPAVFSILVLVLRIAASIAAEIWGEAPLFLAVQVILIVYVFIDYGCMPGRPGPNRYGPSPSGLGVTPPLVLGEDPAPEASALPASPPNA